jgi:hypothetical protein
MVSVPLLAVAGVVALVGILALWQASRKLRPVYHILANDPVPVRDLPHRSGPTEVRGTARPSDDHGTVHTPFTETDCLAFEYETQEYQSQGQHSAWKTLDEGGAWVPFLVEDDTGAVRVDPEGAELHFEEHSVKVSGGDEPPARIAEYIAATDDVDPQTKSIDLVVTELDYGNDQRFVERRLDVGESVYVYGDVGRAPAGEWGSRLVDAELRDGPDLPAFVVSDTSERGTAWRIAKGALGWLAFGLALVVVSVLVAALAVP